MASKKKKDVRLTRDNFNQAIDTVLKKNSIVPEDLMNRYREILSEICLVLQDEVYKQYGTSDNIFEEIKKFATAISGGVGLEQSAGFMCFSAPIVVPLELLAAALMLDAAVIPYNISKLSEYFANDTLAILSTIQLAVQQEKQSILSSIVSSPKPPVN